MKGLAFFKLQKVFMKVVELVTGIDRESLYPIIPVAAKPPDYFGDISLREAIIRKYLKENCSSELELQLPFKYFVNLCFFPKILTIV